MVTFSLSVVRRLVLTEVEVFLTLISVVESSCSSIVIMLSNQNGISLEGVSLMFLPTESEAVEVTVTKAFTDGGRFGTIKVII